MRAGVVFPGETLRTRVWREDRRFVVTTTVERDDAPTLSDAVITVVP
jgi:acyl dehydratase